MTIKNHTLPRKGFTLVELLTVIAIIGILAAIIIPTVGSVQQRAAQTKSSSNMRQIALGYSNFSNSGSRTKTISNTNAFSDDNNTNATSAKDWAQVLAYNVDLVDASLWFIDSDEDVSNYSETLPRSIGYKDGSTLELSSNWSAMNADVPSYAVVVNMSSNAPTSTTPLLWTKGLSDGGEWDEYSAWSGKGGHIAFMDGHVEWFDNLTADENKLSPARGGDPTSNIADAIATSSTAGYYDGTTFTAASGGE